MRRFAHLIVAAIAAAALLGTASPVSAGPAPTVVPHRHFLVTPNGTVPVGPQVCEKPSLQEAFEQFHASVHIGPANSAFDHTHNPVDIQPGLC